MNTLSRAFWRMAMKDEDAVRRLAENGHGLRQLTARMVLIALDAEEWKTIKGTHVLVGEQGQITGGPSKLREWSAKSQGEGKKPGNTIENTAASLRSRIQNHSGNWTLDETRSVGHDIAEGAIPKAPEYKAEAENKAADLRSEKSRLNQENERLNDELFDAMVSGDKAKIQRITAEFMENKARLEKEIDPQLLACSKVIQNPETYAVYQSLSELRPMGGVTEDNVMEMITPSAGSDMMIRMQHSMIDPQTKHELVNGMNAMPQDWLQYSKDDSVALRPFRTDGRGHYSHSNGEIMLNSTQAIGSHEMAHRMEACVPGLLERERDFYNKRTAGEPLIPLVGKGYKPNEKTRKDHFVNDYMGKDYGGRIYELLSMGIQYLQTDYHSLDADPEMREWIIGVLATV